MKAKATFAKKSVALAILSATLVLPAASMAATQEAIQTAIDDGLDWLNSNAVTNGSEVYWSYANNGTLAATASAALAFIEDGYLPGDGSAYDATVSGAVNYIFNRATVENRGWTNHGTETAGYTRIAEDYNNNGSYDDGGNDRALFFNPGLAQRNVYTTGIVAPVIHALGEALGPNSLISSSNAVVDGQSYNQVMQDVVDWFSWGQVEPDRGNHRGGWRYDANYSTSDNSTAQWGSLPSLYVEDPDWSLAQPDYVANELGLYTTYIQNASSGGSGYSGPNQIVNESKTGGLILELLAQGKSASDAQVQAALGFLNTHWNDAAHGTWYGNLNHPYAMWAIYKALSDLGMLVVNDNGTPDPNDDFLVGTGMSNALSGLTIGYEGDTQSSLAGDWYSHYTNLLVDLQNTNGSWNGYSYWNGALATGWYINILNATGTPPSPGPGPVPAPEPGILALLALGLVSLGSARRRRRS